jgi:hypothetical protein
MKKLTMAVGTGIFVVSGLGIPLSAQAKPQEAEPLFKVGQSLSRKAPTSRKMGIYSDCIQTHANINGADFKQVNKFCSCVADQTLQGEDGSLSTCATGGDGGSTLGVIGEIAPSVIMGVVEGLANRPTSSKSGGLLEKGGGGLLEKGGGLIDGLGGLLGGGGGFNLKDLLKNRF